MQDGVKLPKEVVQNLRFRDLPKDLDRVFISERGPGSTLHKIASFPLERDPSPGRAVIKNLPGGLDVTILSKENLHSFQSISLNTGSFVF